MRDEQLVNATLEESVVNYAKLALEAGCDGVVCSPLESPLIHKHTNDDFLTVTPGIRLQSKSDDDQVRITTPEKANELGSNYIVVGRPITRAKNPKETYERIVKEFN